MLKARTKIGIADIIICSCAVVLSLVLLLIPLFSKGNSIVIVQTDGGTSKYDLSDNRTIELSSLGHTLTLEIKDGAVRIAHSDCPDRLCVSSGWINDPARPIVCVPAGVIVRIEKDGGGSDVDVIAGR